MEQTNSAQRETRGHIAIFDEFGRITNFHFDEYNILHPYRNPNPRRAYWNKGELIGPPFPYFKHRAYNPLNNSKPDLGLALEGAYIDVGTDMENTFEEFGNAFKCWMTIKVHYEPVNPNDETHKGFDAYHAAPPTRIFKKDGIVNEWGNPYTKEIGSLTDRIKQRNAKFIRDKSGLVLAEMLKLYLKMASYEPLSGSSWKPLPKFIETK